MLKMPPKEKIPEAYTAIEDKRIVLKEDEALVKSSNLEKEYLVKWKGNIYYANDNATYWQGYAGYPVIAILMLQNKLSYKEKIAKYFKNIDWNKLNKENKRDYQKALEYVIRNLDDDTKENIFKEIDKVWLELKSLDIELTKKKIF